MLVNFNFFFMTSMQWCGEVVVPRMRQTGHREEEDLDLARSVSPTSETLKMKQVIMWSAYARILFLERKNDGLTDRYIAAMASLR